MVCLISVSGPFSGSQENASHLFSNLLLAKLPGLLVLCLQIRSNVTPQKRVLSCLRRLRHALADGSKNLGISKVRDQQSKQEPLVSGSGGSDIVSRPRPALNQPRLTQFAERTAHCDPGCPEPLH